MQSKINKLKKFIIKLIIKYQKAIDLLSSLLNYDLSELNISAFIKLLIKKAFFGLHFQL